MVILSGRSAGGERVTISIIESKNDPSYVGPKLRR